MDLSEFVSQAIEAIHEAVDPENQKPRSEAPNGVNLVSPAGNQHVESDGETFIAFDLAVIVRPDNSERRPSKIEVMTSNTGSDDISTMRPEFVSRISFRVPLILAPARPSRRSDKLQPKEDALPVWPPSAWVR